MTETNHFELLLGLSNLKVLSVSYEPKRITLTCELKSASCTCPNCGKPTTKCNQYKHRSVRDLDISGREVWLELRIGQYHCPDCDKYFNQSEPWLVPRKSYTSRQGKWLFDLCAKQNFTAAGKILNMPAKTVERIYYEYAQKLADVPARYAQVRKLGIDELSHRKGKKDYVCVLVDLERNIILDILPDRKKDTLIAHFQSLGNDFCKQIEVVCCDMWRTYVSVAKVCFPQADITLDRFHIVKAVNDVLDQFRKTLRKEEPQQDVFKYLKWALFKRTDKCTEEQKQDIQKALDLSPKLSELYDLRNQFNTIFDEASSKKQFEQELNEWLIKAENTAEKNMLSFTKTVKRWKKHIISFAETRITNAATEGLNNLIRYAKRISFGLPSFENLRLRILMLSS